MASQALNSNYGWDREVYLIEGLVMKSQKLVDAEDKCAQL